MTLAVVIAGVVPPVVASAAPATPTPATPTAAAAGTSAPAQVTPTPVVPGTKRYIVTLKDTVADPAATAARQTRTARAALRGVYANAVKAYVADVAPTAVPTIEQDPNTQFVVEDRIIRRHEKPARPVVTPPDCNVVPRPAATFDLRPCWIYRVGADRSSTRSGDGRGSVDVNVAVIDDGLDATSPELNIVGGTDCRSGTPQGPQTLQAEHGTEVAGVLAARDDHFGIVGIAPGAPLYGVTIFDSVGNTSLSAILCAVDWTAGTRRDRDPRNDIEVANMSFGDDEADDTAACGIPAKDPVHLAICRGMATGVTYVAAAGNATQELSPPSIYSEVLAATAMEDFDGVPGGRSADANCFGVPYHQVFGDNDDDAAFFSNFAVAPKDRLHTVGAPGACIITSTPSGDPAVVTYAVVDGTSFASPVVAGTAALCISSGKCQRGQPITTLGRLVTDANIYTAAHPAYGFTGDPLRPRPGRYYGPLINSSLY